jgi:squalene-associated FAD-dependent desaturase
MTDCAVIGGGVAGLAAAVNLASHGRSIALFESRPHCGGRSYAFIDKATCTRIDNGQHIMMGCYSGMLEYLRTIGSASLLKPICNMRVPFITADGEHAELSTLALPYPLDALSAFLGFRLLSFSERLGLLRVILKAKLVSDARLISLDGVTVSDWLHGLNQSDRTIHYLWEPIVLATMNARIEDASAYLFVTVLRLAFLSGKDAATFLLPETDLSTLCVDPALDYLRTHEAVINTKSRVVSIERNGAAYKVICENGEVCDARSIIIAVPPRQYHELRRNSSSLDLAQINIDAFRDSEITSVHFWLRKEISSELMTGFLGTTVQWLFAKGIQSDNSYRYAAVISAANSIQNLSVDELRTSAAQELIQLYPALEPDDIIRAKVVREKSATFIPSPGLEDIRPSIHTQEKGIFLAGDWVATGLPATLESAARSGQSAAAAVLTMDWS